MKMMKIMMMKAADDIYDSDSVHDIHIITAYLCAVLSVVYTTCLRAVRSSSDRVGSP